MDVKIKNGDICLNPNGSCVNVSGLEQAVQQVNLAIKIPKNSFIYDRNIGAINDIDFNDINNEKKIEALINECLLHTEVYASVEYIARSADSIKIGIIIDNGYEKCTTEVVIDG